MVNFAEVMKKIIKAEQKSAKLPKKGVSNNDKRT